jgi:hypothetical protein
VLSVFEITVFVHVLGMARPDAGTYTLLVPPEAIRDGRVSARLTISQPGAPPRAPTAREVRSVKLIVGGASR